MKKYLDLEGLQSYDHKMKDYIEEYVEDVVLHNELGYVSEQEVVTNPQYLPNTGDGFINEIEIYGKSVQSGEPTPENPVPIQSVPSSFDITSCGKNLLPLTEYPLTNLGTASTFKVSSGIITIDHPLGQDEVIMAVGPDGIVGVKYKVDPAIPTSIWIKAGTPVTFKLYHKGGDRASVHYPYMRFYYTDGTRTDINFNVVFSGYSTTLTKDLACVWLTSGAEDEILDNYSFGLMLTFGNSPADFLRYIGTTTPIQIRDDSNTYKLCSLASGESDKIVDGKLIKELFEYVVDHTVATGKSINVIISLSNDTYTYFYKSDTAIFGTYPNGPLKPSVIPLCDKFAFLPNTYAQQEGVLISNGSPPGIQIKILNSRAGILSADDSTARRTKIITWLESNPLTVQLAWLTPIVYDLHPDELEKLKTIPTYQGGTNLWTTTNNGIEPDLWTKEFHDSEIGKDVLLKNNLGETLNPITNAGAVLFKDGYDLAEKISQLQKKGKVKFIEPDGMQVTTISMSIGKRYDMYLNSRFESPDARLGRQIVSVVATPSSTAGVPANFTFPVFIVKVIDGVASGVFAYCSVFGTVLTGELKDIGIYYPDGGGSVQEEFYIYKIVEYDEV